LIINQQKLISLGYEQVSKRWRNYLKQPPLYLIGSKNIRSRETYLIITGISILLIFSSLLGSVALFQYWQQSSVQIEINGEQITLGWHRAKITVFTIGLFSLFPLGAILLARNEIRLHRTPPILVWITKEGLNIYKNHQNYFFPWKSFSPEVFEFGPGGTARLPLRKEGESVIIKRLKDPADFFQLLDQYISGNNDLEHYHAYKEQLNATNLRLHFFRKLVNGILYLLKPLTIALIGLPFASIPFIFIVVVHLKDNGELIFRIMDYGMVLLVSIFTLGSLVSVLKSFYLEYKSKYKGQLWQVLTFLLNLGLLIYGLLFFIFYNWIPSQNFEDTSFFERLFYFFYCIIAFFFCLLLSKIIVTQLRPYLSPVLVLREFGSESLAGNWSLPLSLEEYDSKKNSDVFLHEIGGLFNIKKIYAYYDYRLKQDGMQDGIAEFFLQSEEWLNYIIACAKIAQAVIIVPATSKSLLLEMDMLCKEDLLSKTFVLMPPGKEGHQVLQQWERIRGQLTDRGFHLPPYEEGGMVYKPNKNYSIGRSWKLHHSMHNLFFIPRLRKWQLRRYSVYDQIYNLNFSLGNMSLKAPRSNNT